MYLLQLHCKGHAIRYTYILGDARRDVHHMYCYCLLPASGCKVTKEFLCLTTKELQVYYNTKAFLWL